MRVRTLLAVGALIGASVLGAQRIGQTLAVFTDTEAIAGNQVSTTSLIAPTGFTGQANCILAIRSNDLSWNAVSGATSYVLERAIGTGPFLLLATPLGTTWTDLTVIGGTYKYRVKAVRQLWESPVSNVVTLTQPGLCL